VQDPGQVEGNVVFSYLDAFDPDAQVVAELKSALSARRPGRHCCSNDGWKRFCRRKLAPIRARPRASSRRSGLEVLGILAAGCDRARAVAGQTLREVRLGARPGVLQTNAQADHRPRGRHAALHADRGISRLMEAIRSDPRSAWLGGVQMSERAERFGFAAAQDVPIPYLARIREYYQALGYGAPYEWAHYATSRLHRCAPRFRSARSHSSRPPRNIGPKSGLLDKSNAYHAARQVLTPSTRATTTRDHDLRITHVAIDFKAHDCGGLGDLVPAAAICGVAAAAGRIGRVAPRFFGVPTNRRSPCHAECRLPGDRRVLHG